DMAGCGRRDRPQRLDCLSAPRVLAFAGYSIFAPRPTAQSTGRTCTLSQPHDPTLLGLPAIAFMALQLRSMWFVRWLHHQTLLGWLWGQASMICTTAIWLALQYMGPTRVAPSLY